MALTNQTKRKLIAKAHHLHPFVIIGNQGMTENVIAEIDRALFDHELIKIRIVEGEDKAQKLIIAHEICNQLKAEFLRLIGSIVILHRVSDKNKR